ncbi:tyrosine-protein phosphatase [Demequina sp. NBRC 110056]|uniref:tyrosine-protein phosphatase n=1 Tax=Demequina sp. NBRC 110056 TaxID=1570345 RepID=UPI000A073145|nr:tyrosine-protein phosphatase [Demequina sp. NBRC 110056]
MVRASRTTASAVWMRVRHALAWAPFVWKHRVMRPPLDRLANLRDLADAAPGVRSGIAYRSDAPIAGDAAPTTVAAWPPATLVDLRGPGEKDGSHPLGEGVRVVEIDILAAADPTGAEMARIRSLADLYALMIAPGAAPGLTQVVREVAREDAPVLFHCSAGKDRTGVSAALILSLLGVDRDLIVADYHATQGHMPDVIGRMLAGAPKHVGDTPLASVPREVLEAPAAAIETVLDVWDAFDGGVEGWYLAHGGDAETLAALRGRLLT